MKLGKSISIALTVLLLTMVIASDVTATSAPKPEQQDNLNTNIPAELYPIENSLKGLTKSILPLGPQTVLWLEVLPAKDWPTSMLPSQWLKLEPSQIERLLPGVQLTEAQVEILKQQEQNKLNQLPVDTLRKAFLYCIECQIDAESKLGTFTPEQELTKLCWKARLAGSLILSKLACDVFMEKSSATMTIEEIEAALIPEDPSDKKSSTSEK